MTPASPCTVCGDDGPHVRHSAREMMFGTREAFAYAECGTCGLLWLLDVPADMSVHYPPNYYAFRPTAAKKVSPLVRWTRSRRVLRQLGGGNRLDGLLLRLRPLSLPELRWLRVAGATLESRILDVGCGGGERLQRMAQIGFNRLLGVDPFVDADIDLGHGARVLRRAPGDVEGEFDFVMCHHAFEHMPEPERSLREMAERLAPGGTLLVRIPIADSWAWKTYGVDWLQLDAPRHLFLHTRDTMRRLGARVGLQLVRVEDDSGPASIVFSEMYRRDISMAEYTRLAADPATRPFSEEELDDFRTQASALNRSGRADQAAFYYRHA